VAVQVSFVSRKKQHARFQHHWYSFKLHCICTNAYCNLDTRVDRDDLQRFSIGSWTNIRLCPRSVCYSG